jgi:radical SAM superfamily enzyme YgiQ (UPF0313 family)
MDEVARKITSFEPDIVGLTFMTLGSVFLPQFVSMVSVAAPDAVVIAGGYHSSLFPEETLATGGVSTVFVGEAERNILDFVALCETGRPTPDALKEIPGLCFYDTDQRPVRSGSAPMVEDLDTLPFPDFDLIPGYFDRFYGSINRHYLGNPQAFFLTSRGCPYDCYFCGRMILGRSVRSNSNDYVLDLIETCKKKYRIKSIIYGDEFFTLNKMNAIELCESLKERGLSNIEWSCSGRVNNMDFELAQALYGAGCRQIAYGSESGSQKMLDMINKKVTVEQNSSAVFAAARAGLQTYGSFILGCPGETKETLEETRKFILEHPFSFIGLLFFSPLPGSHFYENRRYEEYGSIVNEDLSIYNCFDGLPFVPAGLTAEYLRSFRADLYRDFFLRPSRLVKEFRYVLNPNSWKAFFRVLGLRG